MAKIMLVDDDPDVADFLGQVLADAHVLEHVSDWTKVNSTLKVFAPDLVLMDLNLPVINGDSLIRTLRSFHPELKVVLFSADDEAKLRRIADEVDANGSIQKVFVPSLLLQKIERFL